MGLIGWADAPALEPCDVKQSRLPSNDTYPEGAGVDVAETAYQQRFFASAPAVVEPGVNASLTWLHDGYSADAEEATPCESSQTIEEDASDKHEDLQNELFSVIASLKLRQDVPGQTYDISKIELHEVQFVLDHAARIEALDYYKLARAIHGVKRQLLDANVPSDAIESPNLDVLMDYIEECYQRHLEEE